MIHVIVMTVVAFWKGVPYLNAAQQASLVPSDDNGGQQPQGDTTFSAMDLFKCVAVSAAIGAVLSALFVMFLIRNAKALITVTIYTAIGINIVFAIVCAFYLGVWFGLPWLVFAAISAFFWWLMRRHIPFAAANLSIASKAIAKACGTILFAYLTIALTLVWVTVWGVAALGAVVSIVNPDFANTSSTADRSAEIDMLQVVRGGPSLSYTNDDDNGAPAYDGPGGALYGVAFLLLISFYWGIQVLRNTLHVVTAGTVGTWWATSSAGDPTCGSVRRACTTSFGSIALGSLIIAIIQAIRAFAEGARNGARRRGNLAAVCCAAFAVCLIRMLEDIMRYFTAYAFCQVALYGTSFWESGRNAFLLFTRRGWMAVFNDVIIERTLMLGAFIFGAVCGVASFFISRLFIEHGTDEDRELASIIAGTCGFVVGFLMCAIVAGVIESAVKTVFVCFAERPEALMASHPDEFAEIMGAWYGLKPDLITGAGYDRQFSVARTDYA